MEKKNSRLVAAEIISQWLVDRRFPDRHLAKIEHDNAFIMEVVNGVVRNRNILQWLEQGMVPKEPEPFFKAVLYVGLYQLLFMDNVEEYAAISNVLPLTPTAISTSETTVPPSPTYKPESNMFSSFSSSFIFRSLLMGCLRISAMRRRQMM